MRQENDYREQLEAEFNRRKMMNSKYSLRAFAKTLGVSAPFLSNLFQGKKNLSLETAANFSEKLGFSSAETAQFCQLVQFGNSSSEKVRKAIGSTLNGHPAEAASEDFYPIDLEAFRAISDWYHYAILVFSECREFQEDSSWIARKLGITSAQAQEAIERMVRLNLLKREKGRLVRAQDFFATPSNQPSRALRNFHLQMIEKAKEALEKQNISERDITGITLAISADKVPQAKEEIKKFRRKMAKLMESGRPTSVYQLNIQFFNLIESPTGGKS